MLGHTDVIWYCDPVSQPRKCKNVPCHGHRSTHDQRLTARVVGWVEGANWDEIYQSEYRDRLRKAWQLLRNIQTGQKPGES